MPQQCVGSPNWLDGCLPNFILNGARAEKSKKAAHRTFAWGPYTQKK